VSYGLSEVFGYAVRSPGKNPGVRIQNLYDAEFVKMNVQHPTSNVQFRMKTKSGYDQKGVPICLGATTSRSIKSSYDFIGVEGFAGKTGSITRMVCHFPLRKRR